MAELENKKPGLPARLTTMQRRFAELGKKGIKVKYSRVLDDIISRDERDMERDISPLVMAEDAFLIDSSNLKPNQVLDIAIKYIFRDDKV